MPKVWQSTVSRLILLVTEVCLVSRTLFTLVCLNLRSSGSKPVPSLLSIPHVHFLYLTTPSNSLAKLPFVLSAPKKVIQQVFSILNALLFRIPQPPEFIIVQVGFLIHYSCLLCVLMRVLGKEESSKYTHSRTRLARVEDTRK